MRQGNDPAVKMIAVVFTKSEKEIFDEYKDTFGFKSSADAYRGLIDLVEEKWTGIKLKNDQRFSIRFSIEDYNALENIRENLGGISRSEALHRGVRFLHGVISDKQELEKWKEFAGKIPRFRRTGKKKENSLASGKVVIYTMNDLGRQELQAVCRAFGEERTDILRIALAAAKILPIEKLEKIEEEKFHSTVRLREDEYEKMEMLKARLNYNSNGVLRTGIFLAKRELQEYRMNMRGEERCISIDSDIWDPNDISVDNVRQNVILKP